MIARGFHIIVVVTSDNLTDVDARPDGDPPHCWELQADDDVPVVEQVDFRRAYVDKVDENAGLLHFVVCRLATPYRRTGTKGITEIHREGVMWAQGWSEATLAALRAAYNLGAT